jgi:HK97 family phage major capsid protein
MEIKEQLAQLNGEIKGRLEQIEKGQRDYSDQVKGELQSLIGDYHAKANETAEKFGESQKQLDELETRFKELQKQGMGTTKAAEVAIEDRIAKALREQEAELKRYREEGRGFKLNSKGLFTKAAGTMTFSASTTGQVGEETVLAILPQVERANRIRPLLRQSVMTGELVRFPKDTGGEGTAANQTEGSAKSQLDRDLAAQTYDAQTIAAFLRISNQMLNDINGMASYLSYELRRQLFNQEDSQLLTGDGTGTNLAGLAVNAADATDLGVSFKAGTTVYKWDALNAAIAYLASQDFTADTILVNPKQYYEMSSVKGSNGQYASPFYFDAARNVFTLFGMPVTHSTAVADGSFFVFDSQSQGSIFQREAPSVRFFDQDSDNVQKNLVTVRIEERLAHARFYDNAVFYDTYTDVINAITGEAS